VTDDQTSTVRGDAGLVARAGHLFDAVHDSSLRGPRPGHLVGPGGRVGGRPACACRQHGQLPVRKLFSPMALADEAQRAHLRQ
jgi:hypothetical protein